MPATAARPSPPRWRISAPGDVLALAGKGHESGQTIAGVTTPFDDAAVVRELAGVAA